MEKTYKYLGYILILLIPLTFAGFYKTYFGQFPNFSNKTDVYVHFHALIATIWILMLITQPILILNQKYAAHRTVGKLSYVVFTLLILSFIPRMILMSQSEDSRIIFFPLADCFLLIVFYSLAIYNKKSPPKHMRYMIALAIVFLGPTVGRIGPHIFGWSEILTQFIQYAIQFLILLSLSIYDRKNNREYKPYAIASTGYFVHMIVFYFVFVV